jgi:hypothetical protein
MARIFNLGYYIKECHIQKAIELLDLQLEQGSPLYNTVDFTIYRNTRASFDSVRFHEEFIKRDSFYYFNDIFQLINYYGVQRAYKIREFHYFTWEMLVLYYAVGFYIRDLLDKYITNFTSIYAKKPINVFYGGNINLSEPKKSKIYYYDDYKEFLHLKETLTKPEENKIKYAISLDIKSFFYTINHKILLDIIERKAYPTTKKALHFNEFTKEAIEFFFKYLVKDSKGVPVSGQNIISSFLSSIYFSDFDEFIVDRFLSTGKFHYIRYVDDFYLIFSENSTKPILEIRQEIYDVENEIADFLIKHLKLSISSSKSDRFEIKDIESHLSFLNATGFESPFEQEFDYEELYEDSILSLQIKDKSAPEIFNECIEILKELKLQAETLPQLDIDAKKSSYLNFILIHKNCLLYSKSSEAKDYVGDSGIFLDFKNLDFILIKIKVLLHLITIDENTRKTFYEFLLESFNNLNSLTQKITIIDRFIHQMQFLIAESKGEEKEKLKIEYNTYIESFKTSIKPLAESHANNYFAIFYKALDSSFSLVSFNRIYNPAFLSDAKCIPLVQQIKQRNINEKIGFYNVCFNHLLNEFQNLFEMAMFGGKQVTALEIRDKMAENGFKTTEIKFITEFFDRRNQNSISHTNEQEIGFWGVGQDEYESYKRNVEPIIEKIYIEMAK